MLALDGRLRWTAGSIGCLCSHLGGFYRVPSDDDVCFAGTQGRLQGRLCVNFKTWTVDYGGLRGLLDVCFTFRQWLYRVPQMTMLALGGALQRNTGSLMCRLQNMDGGRRGTYEVPQVHLTLDGRLRGTIGSLICQFVFDGRLRRTTGSRRCRLSHLDTPNINMFFMQHMN